MKSLFDRRQILTALLGVGALPRPAAGEAAGGGVERVDPSCSAGDWARMALSELGRRDRRFEPAAAGAVCDLGPAGRVEVAAVGSGAVRVTLSGPPGELEILRSRDSPRVARVEARCAAPTFVSGEPLFDTLRRTPGGFELTFSSVLALRHTAPRRFRGAPPAVFERLAAAAVSGAGRQV